jgi:hypothetical protein
MVRPLTRLKLSQSEFPMKHVTSLLLLSLTFATGTALAADPPKESTKPTTVPMDHSKMPMSHAGHEAAPDAFAALDTNKDGALSKSELAKYPMAAHASMVDANKDGLLNKSEFAALEGM